MIEVVSLSVSRHGETVLSEVEFNLQRGECVGLIGPPEAGKSLLLKVIAGLVRFTTGEIRADGVPVVIPSRAPPSAWQRRIGFSFQNNALFDAMTVYDNVAFPLRRRQFSEAEVRRRVQASLRDVDLLSSAEALPHMLSGGMQKRVGIARATVIAPDVGLFDDPVAGLDPQTAAILMDMLSRLTVELNMATLVVSNDLDVLLPHCRHVLMLCAGRLFYDGPPQQLVESARREVVQFVTGADDGPL